MNAMKIRHHARQRGITSLYHFTPLDNLESILVNGLVSRQILDEHHAPYVYTDGWRNDGHLDAVSLSIHDINRSMFSSKLRSSRCSWIILEVDASVLWTHPCRFCWTNAASAHITASVARDMDRQATEAVMRRAQRTLPIELAPEMLTL